MFSVPVPGSDESTLQAHSKVRKVSDKYTVYSFGSGGATSKIIPGTAFDAIIAVAGKRSKKFAHVAGIQSVNLFKVTVEEVRIIT